MTWLAICAFLSGALYEMGCVFWVHYSEAGRARPAVGWSMFNAIVTIAGTEAFLTGWVPRVAFVLGFGTGTYFAIRLKRRLNQDASQVS